jgi:glycosyltransferase involved in cell wall biosynthesis
LAFLSRISPKKNLLGAIELMRCVSGRLSLDVYGPIEDIAYWQHCEAIANRLPANLRVHYRGTVAPDAVVSTLAQYDAMFLPTLGENFGHAIIESLAAGCPVVISNRTPWRDLQAKGMGWDLPLESPADFQDALAELVAMDETMHATMRDCARAYAVRLLSDEIAVEQSRRLFQSALAVSSILSSSPRRHAA